MRIATPKRPLLISSIPALLTVMLLAAPPPWALAAGGGLAGSRPAPATTYTITATAGLNGYISPAGPTTVKAGEDFGFSITPVTGFHIFDVLVDSVSVGAVDSYLFTDVQSDHAIHAMFADNTYAIYASAGPGGSIDPPGMTILNFSSDITYTITPDPSHYVLDVLVDGLSVGSVTTYSFTNVQSNYTIEATFASLFTITASASGRGQISPSGAVTVFPGQDQVFSIAPDPGFAIVDVVVDGSSVGALSEYTFGGVAAGHTIHASFTSDSYTITASVGPNGSIAPAGATRVNAGEDITYTITPVNGFNVLEVVVDGVLVGGVENYTFTNVQSDHTIHATFVDQTYAVDAAAGPGGLIAPPGVTLLNFGSDITYTITPDPSYFVLDVRVDGTPLGAMTSYTFTNVQSNHTIEALFAQQFTITASAGPEGQISPSGAVTVTSGSDQVFSITPNPGYAVDDVSVDGVSVGAAVEYTFGGVAADHTIHATFINTFRTITSSYDFGGFIDPLGDVQVASGSDQTFTIQPEWDHILVDVRVDGVLVGPVYTYTFTNVQADHTIHAIFALNAYYITATSTGTGAIVPAGTTFVQGGGEVGYLITPVNGFSIQDVRVDGLSVGPVESYTFSGVSSDHTIHAIFSDNTYSIVAFAGPGGLIVPPGVTILNFGSDITYTITPDAGFIVLDVLVDGASLGAVTSYAFTNVQSSHAIEAIFSPPLLTILASAGGGGEISPSGTVTVAAGGDQDFTITPAPNFAIVDVTADGLSVGPVNAYSFTGVVAGHTIHASFGAVTSTPDGGPATEFAITRVSPNPTSHEALIEYSVARESAVRLSIVDLQGRTLAILFEGARSPGRYSAVWTGEGSRGRTPAGVYFIRYHAGGVTRVKRILLTR